MLDEWQAGSPEALESLIDQVYLELRKIASAQLRRERSHRALETTGLVHEAFLRLRRQRRVRWNDRKHFYRVASQVMRRILIDDARLRLTYKRGRDVRRVRLQDELTDVSLDRPGELVAIDDALKDLQDFDPDLAQVVELRYFTGLTLTEISDLLQVSKSTVSRRWRVARAWLYRELKSS